MKYSGHRKLLCELSKLSTLNDFTLLRYQKNTDTSILVYKQRQQRTGFNMYTENAQQQLTFLALLPCNNICVMCMYVYCRSTDETLSWTSRTVRELCRFKERLDNHLIPQVYYSAGSRRGWIIILYPRYITLQVQGEGG